MASIDIGAPCQSIDINIISNLLNSEKTAGISRQAIRYPSLFSACPRTKKPHMYLAVYQTWQESTVMIQVNILAKLLNRAI